jgi:hypothetical protein
MAGLNEPNDESVRVDLPLPTAGKSTDSKSRETLENQLPVPERMGKSALPSTPLSTSVVASLDSPASGLKKETARVRPAPDPFPSAGETKNPEPRIEMPYVAPQNFSASVASAGKEPMLLWWILLGLSAMILIIQIWTYFS